jgi:hypothetical protein
MVPISEQDAVIESDVDLDRVWAATTHDLGWRSVKAAGPC